MVAFKTKDGTEIHYNDWGKGQPHSWPLSADAFDVPTLFLHVDDDQIVPIGAAAMPASKIVKGAKLKVYKGAPHGMCTTLKDQVNEDLLAFIIG